MSSYLVWDGMIVHVVNSQDSGTSLLFYSLEIKCVYCFLKCLSRLNILHQCSFSHYIRRMQMTCKRTIHSHVQSSYLLHLISSCPTY